MRTRLMAASLLAVLGAVPAARTVGAAAAGCEPTADAGSGRPGGRVPAVIATRDDLPGHAMPAIAASRRNPRELLGAASYVTAGPQPRLVPGAFSSVDGGRTWRNHGPLPLPAGYDHGDDVSVSYAGGTGLVAAEVYPPSGGGSAVLVWRSADAGRHFAPPVIVFTAPPSTRNTDHPWLAAGRDGVVGIAWNWQDALLFARSTDGGRTFDQPRMISDPADIRANVAVVLPGPAGTWTVQYQAFALDAGPNPLIKVVTSTDGGATFGQPRTLPAQPDFGFEAAPFASSAVTAAADPRTGRLYVAMTQPTAGGSTRDVVVYRSVDQGRTWAGPTAVSAGAVGADPPPDRFQPSLAVADDGTLYVGYLAHAAGRVQAMLAASPDRGATFPRHWRLGRPFDPRCGLSGVAKADPWIGDYQGLTTSAGRAYPAWTDAGTGRTHIVVAAVPAR